MPAGPRRTAAAGGAVARALPPRLAEEARPAGRKSKNLGHPLGLVVGDGPLARGRRALALIAVCR